MKRLNTVIVSLIFLLLTMSHVSRAQEWHLGEVKGIDVMIKYSGYSQIDIDGLPIYKLGSIIKYIISLQNTSERQYKKVEVRGTIRYAEDVAGIRWWLDNQYVEYNAGDMLPGCQSEWLPAEMAGGELIKVSQMTPLPLEALPGKIYVELEMRHMNEGNAEDAGTFILFPNSKLRVDPPN